MDAFLLPWMEHLFYALLTVPLVHNLPTEDQVGHRQHWFAMLLGLSVASLMPLPLLLDLISQDHS